MTDKIAEIRGAIAQARAEEVRTGQLETYLAALAPSLHHAIALPNENPVEALLQFVIRYIDNVPDFLETLDGLMRASGIDRHGRVFLTIAEDFFLQPPELVQHDCGLKALIDEAYLAHRLIEEVNDRLLMLCGLPLTPMDMTLSNIIVHDLLGEEFANQLDLAVHYAIEALFQPDNLAESANLAQFVASHKASDWGERLRNWPCLAGDSAIHLNFANGISTKVTEH